MYIVGGNRRNNMSPADFHPSELKIGLNSTVKSVKKDSAAIVFIAYDADDTVKNKVTDCIGDKNITLCPDFSMLQLGVLCSIEVPCAVCCVLKAR